MADAFHQAAVAGDGIGVMVDQAVAEPRIHQPFGERHADGVGDPLAQRPGGGFDAGRVAVFGVTGGPGAELAEVPELVHGHVFVAGQMQKRVKQHRAMPRRQHEAVAVRPIGGGGVELQETRKQNRRRVGHAHGHARVARIGLLDGVRRQKADGIGHSGVADG